MLCVSAECWALTKEVERKLQTTEMKMLWLKCGKMLKGGISNKAICDNTGEELLREQRLRWFGLLEKICNERASVKAKKKCI